MKKNHWLRNTLIVLIACTVAGMVLAAVRFNSDPGKTTASSTLQFSFRKAAEGIAPNGYRYDTSGLLSDEVLEEAIAASGLNYSAEQVRKSLTISGVYPEDIVEQLTKYTSLLNSDMGGNSSATEDYIPTEYSVVLDSDFDRSISREKQVSLLENILVEFRKHFIKTHAFTVDLQNMVADYTQFDYPQQLKTLEEMTNQLNRYAEEVYDIEPSFQLEGKGFNDISARCDSVSEDLSRLSARILLNQLTRNQDRIVAQYRYEIRMQKIKTEALETEMEQLNDLIESYEKDGIIYVSAGNTLQKVGNSSGTTYDTLVSQKKTINDQIAAANARIALAEKRLAGFTERTEETAQNTDADKTAGTEGSADTEAQTATESGGEETGILTDELENDIHALSAKLDAVTADFKAMLEAYTAQQMNESTIVLTDSRYKAPSFFSGTFLKQVLMTAGPLCALGLMVCLVLLIISKRRSQQMG